MKKIAILIENQFDARELIYPYYRLQEEGYQVDFLGTDKDTVYTAKSGLTEKSTLATSDVSASDYDGLVIPGGFSPDYMRRSKDTVNFVKEMDRLEKPIGAICHGPWLLASAANIKGKKLTAYPSIKDDVVNAGAIWQDETLVVDGHYVTAQTPKDLPKFVVELVKLLKQ